MNYVIVISMQLKIYYECNNCSDAFLDNRFNPMLKGELNSSKLIR